MHPAYFIPILLVTSGAILGTVHIIRMNETSDSATFPLQNQTKPLLRFNGNGTFKIAIFADLHYGEEPSTDWGPEQDRKSLNVTGNILSWEDPDLVVFTGDQLTAENMFSNGSEYVHVLARPLVEKGYKWASTFGNHDIGPNVTRLEILAAEQEYDLSYTMQMTDASVPGITNYYLFLYPPEGEEPVMVLWFLDSQGGKNGGGEQPHHIDHKVIEWFVLQSARIRVQYGGLPSLAFFHIPPVEYQGVQETVHGNPLCGGLLDDDVTPQDENTGIMSELVRAGGVMAVYVGHDHGNAWCCYYQGIQVCFGRHTGYGGYGSWTRGSRILELGLGGPGNATELKSYVKLETGEIVDRFPVEMNLGSISNQTSFSS